MNLRRANGVTSRVFSGCALIGAVLLAPPIARGEVSATPLGELAIPAKAPPGLKEIQYFTVDPVADGVLIVAGVGFSEILGRVLHTGEIRPTLPGDPNNLLAIDRFAVTQRIGPHAGLYSDIGLYAAYGYALLDPILSGVRDGRSAFAVDAIIYAESIAIAWAVTDMTKVAIRRPRPIDYVTCKMDALGSCANNTDLQLSFFSGHAATTGAISATAAYLAFMRAPLRSPRPWITLAVGTALTAFVSYERVRSGEHFPTDVMMGSLAGAAIGVLVPHYHRRRYFHESEVGAAPTWLGFSPLSQGQGSVTAGWIF